MIELQLFNGNGNYSSTGKGKKSGGGGSAGDLDANKWDYRGNDQKIEQLENALKNARSVTKINAVAKSARTLDKLITDEIERIEKGYVTDGSLTTLMTQRRKIRQLINKARY